MASDGGLDTSDMNDGDILANTTQVTCKGGHQFKYILPDGHEIKSECVPQEKKKEALHAWVDAVKNAAVQRDRETRQETAARARRARIEREEQEARQLIVPAGTGGESTPPAIADPALPFSTEPFYNRTVHSPSVPSALPYSATDPVSMAKAELVRASLEVQELAPKLAAAQARVKQWQAVLGALNAVELPRESAVIDGVTKLSDIMETR